MMVQKLVQGTEITRQDVETASISPYKAAWGGQFSALLWRNWLSVIKEPLIMKIRFIQTAVSKTFFCWLPVQCSAVIGSLTKVGANKSC